MATSGGERDHRRAWTHDRVKLGSVLGSVISSKTTLYLGCFQTFGGQCIYSRAVVKSTFVESKTSPSPKRFESESSPSPKRFESESSPSPNETVKTEKEKNLLQNHILNY